MPFKKRISSVFITLLCFIFLNCVTSCIYKDIFFKGGTETKQNISVENKEIENKVLVSETDLEENVITEGAAVKEPEITAEITGYRIVFLEITSSEKSNHFEHRVANIYAVNADGSGKELIFSDIEEKYDLGRVYSASPDGTKLCCQLFEGGRGAYTALCVIDTASGEIKKIIEFDYTKEEIPSNILSIYGTPVWSNDSKKLLYEVISTPYERPLSGNFRDAGIFMAEVNSGTNYEVELDLGGISVRTTTFLNPVLLTPDDNEIYTLSHIYSPIKENEEIIGFYTEDVGLYKIRSSGGQILKEIFNVESFISERMEAVRNIGNFHYLKNREKLIFQVLGDFEEDGDIWISDPDGKDYHKLTNDKNLREQQPTVFNDPAGHAKVAYIGSDKYGTVFNQTSSGDLYIINSDGSENTKITDYCIGASNPVFSPDGRYISYLFSTYDENVEYVIDNHIEVYDIIKNEITKIKPDDYLVGNIGWILPDN